MLLLLWSCAGGAGPVTREEPLALWGEVAAAKVEEGEPVQLTVFLRSADAWSAERAEPEATGLELREVEELAPVTLPSGRLSAWRYELRGPPGSYVIRLGSARAEGPGGERQEVEGAPIFVDIGVQGPQSTLSEFEAAPAASSPPWALLGLAALGLAALGLAVLILRRRPAPPPPPPLAPHEQALQDWRRQRAAGLDDHSLALALSEVLRVYLEATTGWPATRRTGPEILNWMDAERVAGANTRLRAARILDATDRLKFAREGGGASFFAELDEDFEAIIEATRPAGGEPR